MALSRKDSREARPYWRDMGLTFSALQLVPEVAYLFPTPLE